MESLPVSVYVCVCVLEFELKNYLFIIYGIYVGFACLKKTQQFTRSGWMEENHFH